MEYGERKELGERLDKMWAEHIIACLAIIEYWTHGEGAEKREYDS